MSNTNVSSADFSEIKQNFINYCKSQAEFTDYAFEGSATNFLLDILAYNTHYNAVNTNLAFSETFLDSASIRNNIVSRAQELGYVPRSKTAATATITMSFSSSGNPPTFILPIGTKFTSNNGQYSFVLNEDVTFKNSSNTFSKNIEIIQGKRTSFEYTIDASNPLQRIIVPDKNADISRLEVYVKDSSSSTSWVVSKPITDLTLGDLSETTNMFILRETYDGYYQLIFGDGVIARQLKSGNIVKLNYIICDGEQPNGARSFALASTVSGISGVTLTTVDIASGGSEREDIESIRYMAPLAFQAQDRAVTENDYVSILKNKYANIDDVSVWGGEKNDPPFYGKVFVCIKPKSTYTYLSSITKQKIQNELLSKHNILTIRPEIVDPDYIFVNLSTVVTYDKKTYSTSSQILDTVNTAIDDFFAAEGNKFAKPIYMSKLVTALHASSSVIKQVIINYTLEKHKEIFAGISGSYTFNFNNSINPSSIYSNVVSINGQTYTIKDSPTGTNPYTNGVLGLYDSLDRLVDSNIGTVDYNLGKVVISNIKIDTIPDDQIYKRLKITAATGQFVLSSTPEVVYRDMNIYPNGRDQIISLNSKTTELVSD